LRCGIVELTHGDEFNAGPRAGAPSLTAA
jgi:hypothetical protein